MELKDIILMRKLSGIPQPTVADAGKTPVVDQNGKYQLVDLGPGISYEVVSQLPSEGEAGVIYLVANGAQTGTNIYDEYIWTGSAYEIIGTTEALPQVVVISGITQNVSQLANAELAIQSALSGKIVIAPLDSTSEGGTYGILLAGESIQSTSTVNAVFLAFENTVGLDSSLPLCSYVYDATSDRFVKYNYRLPNPFPTFTRKATSNKSQQVYQANDTPYLYVDVDTGTPLPPQPINYYVCGVDGNNTIDWVNIKTRQRSETYQGDLGQIVYYAVTLAKSNGTGSVYMKDASIAALISQVISYWGASSYTDEFPHLTIGDLIGSVIYSTDNKMVGEVEGFDLTDNTFVKAHIVAGIDSSGGSDEGYVCVHAESIQCSPLPSA